MDSDEDWEIEWEDDRGDAVVRPYLMTNGRTSADGPPVFPETIVVARASALLGAQWLTFERQSITVLAAKAQSVAELSATLQIPLGTTMILVSDMVAEGLLTASESIHTAGTDVLRRIRFRLERIGNS
jgi:hypothetical protein